MVAREKHLDTSEPTARIPEVMASSMKRSTFAALGAAAVLAPAAVRAADPIDLKVNIFPGASAMPLYYGLEHGFFARGGLNVTVGVTTSSTDQFTRLSAGEYDIAHTAIDNPIAYDIGRGAPGVQARDFVAWFGIDDGGLPDVP